MKTSFLFPRLLLCTFFTVQFFFATAQRYTPVSKEAYTAAVKKASAFLEADCYSLKLVYTTFVGHGGTAVFETAESRLYKNKSTIYTEFQERKGLSTPEIRLAIDEETNAIILSEPVKNEDTEIAQYTFDVQMQWVQQIEEAKEGSLTRYRITYRSGYQVEKMELTIEQNRLKEWQVYYAGAYPSDPENADSESKKPRMHVAVKDYKTYQAQDFKTTSYASKMNISTYLYKTGGKYLPAGQYKAYELLDSRVGSNEW